MANQTNYKNDIVIKRNIKFGNDKDGWNTLERRQICKLINNLLEFLDDKHLFYEYIKIVKEYTLYCHKIGDIIINPAEYNEILCHFRWDKIINDNRYKYPNRFLENIKKINHYLFLCFCAYTQINKKFCKICEKQLSNNYWDKHLQTKYHLKREDEKSLFQRFQN